MSNSEDYNQLNFFEGKENFNNARFKAFWDEVRSKLIGEPVELMSFDDVKAHLHLHGGIYKGLQNIPIDRIAGSVNKHYEFTRHFFPKKRINEDRWSRVYAKTTGMMGVPPIELYKVDDVYFVVDGNHRVSIARQMGNKTIEAYVTEFPTNVDIEPEMTDKDIVSAVAQSKFLEATNLQETRPEAKNIRLSHAEHFAEVMKHIHIYQYSLEDERDAVVTVREAAVAWFDNVYIPIVTLIRKYKLLQDISGKTEGDLYLWLVDSAHAIDGEHNSNRAGILSKALRERLINRYGLKLPRALMDDENNPP